MTIQKTIGGRTYDCYTCSVAVKEDMYKAVSECAEKAGINISMWIRSCLVDALVDEGYTGLRCNEDKSYEKEKTRLEENPW